MCLLAKKRKGLKSFLAESPGKNWNYLFYPSAKSRRELKIKTLGVTFRGASALDSERYAKSVCLQGKIATKNFIFLVLDFSFSASLEFM